MARRPRRLDQLAAIPELVLGVVGAGLMALGWWLAGGGQDPTDLEQALVVGDEHGLRP